MQTCPQCKAKQLDGMLFCSECGANLFVVAPREITASLGPQRDRSQPIDDDDATEVEQEEEPEPPPTLSEITLVVLVSGRRITLDASDDLLVGRKDNARGIFPDIDLGLDGGYDAGVSRRHAIISSTPGGWTIEDLGSANGTFVNGRRLDAGKPAAVGHSDELKFGTLVLRLELE
jgi:uncharacterized Zn finger protein (UPF0148 family)